MRFDIVSDTHGYLSDELLSELRGADVIVHAGDMCSESDFHTLNDIAMTYMCRGNNDWGYTYDSFVTNLVRFFAAGLRWEVCHYQESLDLAT
ncbi:MAG: metallophosphoesterase family protein, partial [Parafannyhessea umbonata]|nr:metallophosphoesterase family protein [Parafannyhessea umbonata]